MKKYVWLIGVTAVIAVFILWSNRREEPPVAETYTVTATQAERTVKCTGVIAASEYRAVLPPAACVVGKVRVKEGDTVKAGDVLFTVDLEATQALLVSSGKLSTALYTRLEEVKEITAPLNGVVTSLSLVEGSPVDAAKACAVIAGTDHLQVALQVPESKLNDVWVGQTAKVQGDGFKKDAYTGTVTFLSAAAGSASNRGILMDATVALNESELDASLRLGLSARVHLLAETYEEARVLPYGCLQKDDEGEFVLVVNEGVTEKRRVTVKAELTEGAVIGEGIAVGERLIRNAENFTPGQAVTVK